MGLCGVAIVLLIWQSESEELVFLENEKLKACTIDYGVDSSMVFSRQLELRLSGYYNYWGVRSSSIFNGTNFYFYSLCYN
jgi:hypothetical protein